MPFFQKRKIMIRKFLLTITAGTCFLQGFAQKAYNEQVQDYITRYKDLAMLEQRRTGVPAAITLAQGIFETAAGSSELCTNASNHFGIKCKNTWTGDTYTYTDDARDECFRKYESAIVSYQDHSDFLKTNKRYASLFTLSTTDYAAWAHGLKRCGYATNPQYAVKLIKTIEDYHLQDYTFAALNSADETLLASAQEKAIPRMRKAVATEQIPERDLGTGYAQGKSSLKETDEIIVGKSYTDQNADDQDNRYYQPSVRNGLKGFLGRKGDMLLEYAIRNKIRYAKLLELNDLPDAPLEADMFIYLERKSKTGNMATHKVAEGETMLQISQQEGIQLAQLRTFNHMEKGEEPLPGAILQLQTLAAGKPALYNMPARSTGMANNAPRRAIVINDDGYVTAGGGRNPEAQQAVADEPAETEEDIPATPAARRVNIANEKPVEETIAEERRKNTATVAQRTDSKMSALDKLKAHMDKTVYAEKEFVPKSSGNYEEKNEGGYGNVRQEEPISRKTPASPTLTAREKTRSEKDKNGRKAEVNAKGKAKSHTVRKGESLFEIAQKYDVTVAQLQKMNKLGGKKTIQPGMKLKVK